MVQPISLSLQTRVEVELGCDNKMLVLDLKFWMGDDGTVWWEHYRKTMTNYLVMLECSAMPNQMKRTTLTQEGVRVLRNCRLDISWEMKAVHLTDLPG